MARRCRQPGSARGGFTLVEVVVSLAVLGFIGVTAATVLFEGVSAYHRTTRRKEAVDGARLTMERMVREVRQTAGSDETEPVPQIVVADADQLQFDRVTADGTERVILRLVQGSPDQIQLAVGSTDNARPLLEADSLGLTFTYYAGDGTTLGSVPLSSDDIALVRRIGITVTRGVAAFEAGVSEPDVTLSSSCYLRNMIGEVSD